MDQQNRTDPVTKARDLGPAIVAAADELERTRRIPAPLLEQLHASRLLRMQLPRSVDGDQTDPMTYLAAIEELSRHDGSIGWNVFVANSSALIAPFLEPDVAREIFANPKAVVAWGPPNACKATAVDGGYLISGKWDFASGCRQATWMGAHGPVVERDGSLRRDAKGHTAIRSLLFPVSEATLLDTWNPIGLRGTASDSYRVDNLFVAERFSSTRNEPELRRERGPLYAFTMQGLYAVGVAGVALGLARAMLGEFIELARRKAPRYLTRLADNAVIQADVARAEASLGASRAYLVDTLATIYAHADDIAPIDIADRARVRLACTHAIHTSLEVADFTYKGAGVDAIFPGSPFERRFRDIHTVSQQIQSRSAHYEAVGRILLGTMPEVFF
jgi:alkylation response protein AidB-like acyl-CoA dehydrogenase